MLKDSSDSVETAWRKFDALPSDKPGFARVSTNDSRYFEFDNGDFFYPTGFNIHSVKDLRSEDKLKLGYRPDRGNYSYEEYFDAMAANGVNAVEIWMAAWSFAIEWTSARTDYHGLGRYNLYNAWRLDRLLEYASKKGIFVHLVLDNHGKLSSSSYDPEWNDSPHNRKRDFATADGAMLEQPGDFFSNKDAWKFYQRRNRYIAARWGADPAIFGIELWSEIDLVTDIKKTYDDGSSVEWHRNATAQLESLGLAQIMTTHTCGDYNHPITYRKYYEDIPLISYVVGDAYRDKTPIVEHLKEHTETLAPFKKPLLITEYGGTAQGAAFNRIEADLHAGIWASFFLQQAGTPFLWWHDFVHDKDKYKHYLGFSKFIRGVDPRAKKFRFRSIIPTTADASPPTGISCLASGDQNEHYAWIYKDDFMFNYPDDPDSTNPVEGISLSFEAMLPETRYRAEFLDTVSGQTIISQVFTSDLSGNLTINAPPFKVDTAVKIKTAEE